MKYRMKKAVALSLLLFSLRSNADSKPINFEEFNASVGVILFKASKRTVCSGVLLTPQIVLTAGHCTHELLVARVLNKGKITKADMDARKTPAQNFASISWVKHPGFVPKTDFSTDLALLFLKIGFDPKLHYPTLAPMDLEIHSGEKLERVGFGKRNNENKRTWQDQRVEEIRDTGYLKVQDQYGEGGDSGGPVYIRKDGKLYLLGIHTGRARIDGDRADYSFVFNIQDKEIRRWIETEKLKFESH